MYAIRSYYAVKLIRTLWIIPLSLIIAMFSKKDKQQSIKFPWFILFFVLAIVFANLFPSLQTSYVHFTWLGKRGILVALFLISYNFV